MFAAAPPIFFTTMYSRYNLRSSSTSAGNLPAPPPPTAPGYQPPGSFHHRPQYIPTQNTAAVPPFEAEVDTIAATLDSLLPIIQAAKPTTPTETSLLNVVQIMIGQMKAINQKIDRSKATTSGCLKDMDNSMVDVTRGLVKTEQYNRRDTITVTGLQKETEETEETLTAKIVETLSVSGETVTAKDFTAVHRNGQKPRTTSGKNIPPSVTVKFHNISKKDKVLKNYKNYDFTNKKARTVKCFQSLSPHYTALRQRIVKFFDEDNDEFNSGKRLKWCTYQSPTAGLVVKLQTDEYMRDIHVIDDFYLNFEKACPPVIKES